MDRFYRAFEEHHRGPRELIESRLEVYLPFVEPLRKLYEAPEILDLGCGRGEWLELMKKNGFQAKGVDLDEGMLLACRELNLNVCQVDALDYLRGLEAESLTVVSAFHFVEHISFDILRQLVDEAHRVLKSGGLLILETPNSENLVVGTSSFYLDPTHQRPLPAQLLSFVVEYAGFKRVKTLFLQERPGLATAEQTTLLNVLDGVSPDYAVIAQKNATADVCALFKAPFERSFGLRLTALAERYDQQTQRHTQWLQNERDTAKQRIEELSKSSERLEAKLIVANEHNTQLQAHAQWLQNELNTASAKVDKLNHDAHKWWAMADQLNQEQQKIYSSKFWRLTWPLRKIMQAAKGALVLPARTIRWALRLPKRIAMGSSAAEFEKKNFTAAVCPQEISEELIYILSPRAAHIYTDLKKAIEARNS
jgi:SAM-dependent methyltransferase